MSAQWLDVLAAVCIGAGAFLALVAGVGLLRFPDLLSRMHTGAKPQVLGVLLALLGLALRLRDGRVGWTLLLVGLFQLLTIPVSVHMLGRAGYRTRQVGSDLLIVDELTDDLERAREAAEDGGE